MLATYEMGRQPFGLASPAAFLRAAGHTVRMVDASVETIPMAAVREAELIGFHLPMHTATRLAAPLIGRIRAVNPAAAMVAYGLYAPINAAFLRGLGVRWILGGECEGEWVKLAADPAAYEGGGEVSLERLVFPVPDRAGLPVLNRYAALVQPEAGERVVAGYTEASRGCLHRCRHCPVVPVYNGQFRVVTREAVLADIRQQVVEGGARHIAFGDPDFFNGPTHAVRIVEALAAEFPGVTYDVTIKVEHLLRHRELLPVLARTGCALVTTAVESLDDRVLALLEKGHTRADFYEVVALCRAAGLALAPTFVAFTPWTTLASYREMLAAIAELGLVENVAPVQLALRLLVTANSRLLELGDIRSVITGWDAASLTHRWRHPDAAVDALAAQVLRVVDEAGKAGLDRAATFGRVADAAGLAVDLPVLASRATVPYLTEPWYC